VPRIQNQQPLNDRDRKNLALLLEVARQRGIELPKEAKTLVTNKKNLEWPVDPNGYFVRDDGKNYNPSEAHKAFIESNARYVMLYGPRGCGKSGGGSQKAMRKIMQGESGIIMNPDFENLKISTWPEFKRWIPWHMVVVSQRHRRLDQWQPSKPFVMVFMNGAKVYIKGGKDAGSSRGPNVNWFWYDEGGRDETGVAWQVTNGGVRIGNNPQSWCTETPRPTEHWSYKFFIKKEIPEDAKIEFEKATKGDRILVECFHATREDNKVNLDATYYAGLSVTYPSGWMRAQEFDGEFANEGGQIGDRNWFNGKFLDERPNPVLKRVRFWDLAATEKKTVGIGVKKKEKNDPDESVGTLLSSFMYEWEDEGRRKKDTNWCIEHQVHGFWSWERLLEAIVNTARHDGPYVPVVLEEEPGSGGKNQVAAVKTHFKSFPELAAIQIIGQRARDVGDRVMAANHWFSLAAEGKMWMCKGEWNEKTLGQLDGFTQIEHDDRITSITGAMTYIRPFKAWVRVPFISL
jgi:phage terminase large subunit-like protein